MTARHTLLFRLIGPMQAWGYRSRFEDRDTGLEPTRSGVFGLLASASGIERGDLETLRWWDETLRFGVRIDLPKTGSAPEDKSGFRVETDFHTAQDVLRATGKGTADTVLSRRHYLTDARYTVGLESSDLPLLKELEAALKNPVWTLSLGRKSFPLSLPPWLPNGGLWEKRGLLAALKSAPFPLLSAKEALPSSLAFVLEPDPASETEHDEIGDSIPMRLADRPLDFNSETRRFGLREVVHFRLKREQCVESGLEADPCFSQK